MPENQMTFGLTLPQRGVFFGVTTMDKLLDLAVQADRSGAFDSVWVGDSLFSKPRPESLTLLAALAAKTENVLLAVGCMATFPIRDPIVFAYQWANLDLISNGRMLLAACTGIIAGGASIHEGHPYGVVDKDRPSRLEENIEVCRRLWSGDNVSFEGQYHSFTDLTLLPKPVQQPCPIWIASNPRNPKFLDRSMSRVARLADGWMSTALIADFFANTWQVLQQHLREAGKDPATFPNTLYANFNINEDREAALEETMRFLTEYYGPIFTPQMVDAWTATGSPQQVMDRLRQWKADGAKRIALRPTAWDVDTQYKRLVNEVLPHVNEA